MNLRDVVVHAMVATCLVTVGLATYDRLVRVPSTPRLAVVDVARLYNLAERVAATKAVGTQRGDQAAGAAVGALFRTAEDFGPLLEGTLRGLATECQCTLVAMAAVVGDHPSMPDFTSEAARRLQLQTPAKPEVQR